MRDVTFKGDFTYVYTSKDILDVGFKINSVKLILNLQNSLGELRNIGEQGATVNSSIYAKYQLLRIENLGLEIGTRLNMSSLGGGDITEILLNHGLG